MINWIEDIITNVAKALCECSIKKTERYDIQIWTCLLATNAEDFMKIMNQLFYRCWWVRPRSHARSLTSVCVLIRNFSHCSSLFQKWQLYNAIVGKQFLIFSIDYESQTVCQGQIMIKHAVLSLFCLWQFKERLPMFLFLWPCFFCFFRKWGYIAHQCATSCL